MHNTDHGPIRPTTQGGAIPVAFFALNADPLLTAKEAAAYRRHGLSTFWRHVKQGLVPKPIYITPTSPRWRLSDLCPAHATSPSK